MKKVAVIGNPVEHSRSPGIFAKWFSQYNIEAEYEKVLCTSDDFSFRLNQLKSLGYIGVNITIPFKEVAFKLCDEVSERANLARAVNCITFEDGKIVGDNTDVLALTEVVSKINPTSVVILGAGGAARAAIVAMKVLGCSDVKIYARNPARVTELLEEFPFLSVAESYNDIGLIINATPIGLGVDDIIPDDLKAIQCDKFLDLVYSNGHEVAFKQFCNERRINYIDGTISLELQARPCFERWFLN